ncbi:MAG: hypothetical protein M3O35_19025 [Acidobacteriota bacterium]|nr:hypothetical protein [Acidobacteriota bacterium]
MHFYRKSSHVAQRIGILAGSFNPPTIAHVELAQAAGGYVDEVVCVVPRVFPHKPYFGATLEQRIEMLEAAGLDVSHSIGVAEGGLFAEIAEECRPHYPEHARFYFLCGRDAAERIIGWDYGEPGAIERILSEFELLVAPRGGPFVAPPELRERVHSLPIGDGYHEVSSTEVRDRISRGESWEHLVPARIVPMARAIYS